MIFIPLIILSLIQGITEFLPISSSGHLIFAHHFLNDFAPMSELDQKRMDIAVHIGTLLAVMLYFKQDTKDIFFGGIDVLRLRYKTAQAREFLMLTVCSIPVMIVGLIIFMIDLTIFDSLYIIGWTSIIFGILLYFADKRPQSNILVEEFSFKQGLIYGFSQCIALIPGVSRSGITMTVGRFMGHSRVEAARFSMLLGIVTISAAGALTSLSVFQDSAVSNDFIKILGIAVCLAFASAYLTIFLMMRWIKNGSFTPFVVYRIGFGIIVLYLLYSGVITEEVNL
jgi:undecaprenyl-diphosphatase